MLNDIGQVWRRNAVVVAGLAALWLILVAIAHPVGEFPLNDDWNYALTVKSLLAEHRFIVTQWSLAACLTQTLIGCVVCLPFGFSFQVLRNTAAVMGLAAAAFSYFLCRRTGASLIVCLLCAMTLLVNPLFFNLAVTFMTDVPFIALAAVTLFLMERVLNAAASAENTSAGGVTLGQWTILCLTCTAACLLRQTGLVLPVSFAIVALLQRSKRSISQIETGTAASHRVRGCLLALAPLLISLVAVVVFQLWLNHTAGTLYSYQVEQAYLKKRFSLGPFLVSLDTALNYVKAGIYLGIFTLPVMPVVYPRFLSALAKAERFFAVGLAAEFAILIGVGLLFTGSMMPLVDNIFYNLGLGPLLLGLDATAISSWPKASAASMTALALIGVTGAGLFVSILVILAMRWTKRRPLFSDSRTGSLVALCLLSMAFYLLLVCVRGFFDRYLLFPFLLLLPILAASSKLLPDDRDNKPGIAGGSPCDKPMPNDAGARDNKPGSAGGSPAFAQTTSKNTVFQIALCLLFMLPLAYFSVAATHDYFSWNRARWVALDELTRSGVSPLDIDGGLEFNGWYGYDPRYREKGITFSTSMRHGDAYALALNKVRGYEVIGHYPFDRWMPSGTGEIVVLKKQ